ncbi:hypothetical protein [Arsukibacterium sp.]|uniref:hypothetical protein n=1 Tax=Arsukibacterium sp. TaxID=1977258 RepID=UPI001BD5E5E6|nr:hypothetical protein [Arsukibacterium sp.]
MAFLTLISIVVVVNITLAFVVKKSFGLTLFEAWPTYKSEWKNILAAMVPVALWVVGMASSYFIYALF